MAQDIVVEACEVEKRIRSTLVLKNCSLQFGSGELVLLLGSNGAGKSTLLRILSGLLRPHRGLVRWQKSGVRYVGHDSMLFGELSVEENLRLFASLEGASEDSISSTLEEWGLSSCRSVHINQLSKGQRARTALARVFLGAGPLLLLDEPSSALDDNAARILGTVLSREQMRGTTCIVATHDLARLSSLASRVIILCDGQVMRDSRLTGTIAEAMEQYRELNR